MRESLAYVLLTVSIICGLIGIGLSIYISFFPVEAASSHWAAHWQRFSLYPGLAYGSLSFIAACVVFYVLANVLYKES